MLALLVVLTVPGVWVLALLVVLSLGPLGAGPAGGPDCPWGLGAGPAGGSDCPWGLWVPALLVVLTVSGVWVPALLVVLSVPGVWVPALLVVLSVPGVCEFWPCWWSWLSLGLGVPALLWKPSLATASFPGTLSPESPWGLGESGQGCKMN